jgi:hypothetical protein
MQIRSIIGFCDGQIHWEGDSDAHPWEIKVSLNLDRPKVVRPGQGITQAT